MARSIKAAGLALVAGLWGSGAGAAPAVTAPSGGTHVVGTPLTVTWSGIPGASVHLEIVLLGAISSSSVITYPWMASVPNTGTFTGPSPTLFCAPQPPGGLDRPISQWTAMALVGGAGQGSQAIGPGFKLACPQTGALSVKKVVVNATGGAAPAYPLFNITVTCTPPAAGRRGSSTSLQVGADQAVSLSALLAAGSSCRATEAAPAPIRALRACKGRLTTWTTSYSPAAIIPASGAATLTVTNTLACAPG